LKVHNLHRGIRSCRKNFSSQSNPPMSSAHTFLRSKNLGRLITIKHWTI